MSTLNAHFVPKHLYQSFAPSHLPKTSASRKVSHSDAYRGLIWALARKFTNSREEAEVAAEIMFTDIRRQAEIEDRLGFRKRHHIDRIALARLIRSVW